MYQTHSQDTDVFPVCQVLLQTMLTDRENVAALQRSFHRDSRLQVLLQVSETSLLVVVPQGEVSTIRSILIDGNKLN